MKTNREVPVTAFTPGEGLLPNCQRLVRQVVIPYQYQVLNDALDGVEKSHALENLRLAARKNRGEAVDGEFYGMVFQDSDVAKWLEAAAYSLALGPDPALQAQADQVVGLLEEVQQPDGYLNSYFTVKEPDKKWTNLQEAHELYCAGHLMEAAVAWHEATGDDRLLRVMEKNARCLCRQFLEENPRGYSGHPEVELALLRLYRATGDETYRKLCAHFLDVRGQAPNYFIEEKALRGWNLWGPTGNDALDTDYTQSTLPVREQKDAVGHAVRAVYLYTAMADLAGETGDEGLATACRALWESIAHRRMYVTGGIGSTVLGEAFTVDFDLPNDTVYAETCASIGLIFFARRMLQLELKGEYGDVMERALYNTVLAGMELTGKRFFYCNPLEVVPGISGAAATQRHDLPQRPPWYACACCPPNVARLLASLGTYAYGEGEGAFCVHLYLGGRVRSSKGYSLSCRTDYPRSGRVVFTVEGSMGDDLWLRVPGWSRRAALAVNGEERDVAALLRDGYARVPGPFAPGDEIALSFDMPPRKVYASGRVPADTGKAAVQRGPVVYCAEGVDNGGGVLDLSFREDGALWEEPFDPGLLGGVVPLKAEGWRSVSAEELYTACRPRKEPAEIALIPYYAWGNRGENEMRVWLPEN